jgi:hypothetical protein
MLNIPGRGSAADRGSADRYYHRPRNPHMYPGYGKGNGPRVLESEMTIAEKSEYNKAYDEETDRKDWG